MRRRFVLDTNCIIDLEEDRENARALRELIDAWKSGHIDLAVVAVSASENQKDGLAGRDFSAFEAKLARAGLTGVTMLLPLMMWDVSFWDHALWTNPEMEALANRLRDALFPNAGEYPPSDVASNSKWRNQLCDAVVAWSCIYHAWPCLVTSDGNFHKHAASLRKLGLSEVVYPIDAAGQCAI